MMISFNSDDGDWKCLFLPTILLGKRERERERERDKISIMVYCQKCGVEGYYPKKYNFPNGQEMKMNHCNSCASEVYRYIRDEWREIRENVDKAREKAKKEQETKEKAEKQKKFNDWKSSHCAKCGTKSLLWHYIYDRRTSKLDWSMDNATNPDQQWVFCDKEHFQEWHNQHYYQCQECSKTGLGGALYNKKDGKKFCSDGCYGKYYAKDCDDCGVKAIKAYYKDSDNKTGNLCENCYDLKKLKEELEKLKDKVKENAFTCSQCSKNRTGEDSCFYNSVTNDGKKFCSKECFAEHYGEKCDVCSNKIGLNDKSYYQDAKNKTGTLCSGCWKIKKDQENNFPSSPEQEESNEEKKRNERPIPLPTSPNHPSFFSQNNNQEKCGVCDKTFESNTAEEHSSQNPQCKNYADACTKILNGQVVNYSELDLSERGRIIIKALQELKIEKKWVDIDSLNLPQEAKEGLKQLRKQLGIKQKIDFGEERTTKGLNTPGKIGVTILSIFGFVILLIVLRKHHKNRLKKIKSN